MVELRGQRVEVRDGGRGRDAVVVRVLLVAEEVEVRAAVRMLLRARQGLSRDGDDGDAGRQRDALLHAGQADVEVPFVEPTGMPPREETASTRTSVSGDSSRTTRASAATSFVTPVQKLPVWQEKLVLKENWVDRQQ